MFRGKPKRQEEKEAVHKKIQIQSRVIIKHCSSRMFLIKVLGIIVASYLPVYPVSKSA